MKTAWLTGILWLGVCPWSAVPAQTITSCDWEVAHPSDPNHVGPGVSSGHVDTPKAIAACREAISLEPENPRFHYQLARALVYHADRHGGSDSEGMKHLAMAADQGYTQAMFVYGLMLSRHGETCAVEPWIRKAADRELKAARMAYVDHYLAGTWTDCGVESGLQQVQGYLEQVSSQVSGYYENMLVRAMGRELATMGSAEE